MTLAAKIADMIRRGDAQGIIDALIAATEKERRAAFPAVNGVRIEHRRTDQELARAVGVLGTGTTRDIRNMFGRGVPPQAVDLVLTRPANVRDGIVRLAIEDDFSSWLWPIVRDLVVRGEIEEPEHEGYVLGILRAAYNPVWMGSDLVDGWWDGVTPEKLAARLRSEPELIEIALRAIDHDLDGPPHFAADIWFATFPLLVESGHIERDRMLDTALNGYLSDFRPVVARRFGGLWKALKPTDTERATRSSQLLQLVVTRDPGAQKIGLAELSRLQKKDAIDDLEHLADACRTPLSGTQKNLAVAALRLLAAVGRTHPDVAVLAACVGLGHPRADVQEASLDLVEKLFRELAEPAPVQSELLAWVGAVAPQLRGRIEGLVGVEVPAEEPASDVDLDEVRRRLAAIRPEVAGALGLAGACAAIDAGEPLPPAEFVPWTAPVLHPTRRIEPVHSIDELVEVIAAVLTGSVDGIDIERALDGMSRFAGTAPDATARSTIQSNIDALVQRWGGLPSVSIVDPILAWALGRPPGPLPFVKHKASLLKRPSLRGELVKPRIVTKTDDAHGSFLARHAAFDGTQVPANFDGMGSSRAWEVAVRCIEGAPQPLLAMPTHRGGWIDPEALADRLEAIAKGRGIPDRFDASQALLRLVPHTGEATVRRLGAIDSPVAPAAVALIAGEGGVADEGLRRAIRLTADVGQPVPVYEPPSQPQYAPIVGARFPDAGDGSDRRRDDPLGMVLAALRVPRKGTYWWSATAAVLAPASHSLMAWATIGAPRVPDILGAAAAVGMAPDLDSNRSSDMHHVALAALLSPDVPLGSGAHTGIAIALSNRNELAGTTAVDLLGQAIADGRLDPERLGAVLATFADAGVVALGRSAPRLAQVTEISLLHADQVRRALVGVIADLGDMPRDIHSVLEVLVTAGSAVQRGVPDAGAIAYLERLVGDSPRSKRGKLARAALDLPRNWATAAPEALQAAAILERAERWANDD